MWTTLTAVRRHLPPLQARRTSAALAACAFAITVSGSAIPSLWADEGATISAVDRPLPALWALIHKIDAVHAVYYVLLHAWTELVGVDPFWVRLPSAVAVGAAAFALHRLALLFLGPRGSLWAVMTFSVLPRVTWMGIEARSSALSSLVVVLATLVLVQSWRRDRPAPALVGYALLVAIGVALHLYVVLLLPAHLAFLWAARAGVRMILRWGAAALAGVAAASPMTLLAFGQAAQVGGSMEPNLLLGLRQIAVNQYFLGERPLESGVLWLDLWQYASVLLALVIAAVIGWACWRCRAKAPIALLALSLTWALLPGLAVLALSVASGHNLYHPRYFAFGAAAVALMVGWAISQLRSGMRAIMVVALVVALAVPIYLSQRSVNAKMGADWSQVVSYVESRAAEGDGIYFSFTNRIITIAYPGRLDRLRDVTLDRDRVTDASLVGKSLPLTLSLTPSSPSVIWAIYRLDRADRATDESVFRAAGYRPTAVWDGTWDEVVRYHKQS